MNARLDDLKKSLGFDAFVLRYDAESDQPFEPCDVEPGDFIRRKRAEIIGLRGEDQAVLGHIAGYLFHLGSAENDGEDIVHSADGGADLCGAAETLKYLYDEAGDLIDDFCGQSNGLYIHELYVGPEYRGHKLGRYALYRFIDWHDPSCLLGVVGCANTSYFGTHDASLDVKQAQRKLEAYYRSLGFKKMPVESESEFMWLSIDDYDPHWRFGKRGEKAARQAEGRP